MFREREPFRNLGFSHFIVHPGIQEKRVFFRKTGKRAILTIRFSFRGYFRGSEIGKKIFSELKISGHAKIWWQGDSLHAFIDTGNRRTYLRERKKNRQYNLAKNHLSFSNLPYYFVRNGKEGANQNLSLKLTHCFKYNKKDA